MPIKKPPSPPGADPLDLRPNRVNAALLSPGGDPDSFPIEVSWLDLIHDKGHSSRASGPWMERFLTRRVERGDDPAELACRVWVLAHLGVNAAASHFLALLRLAPGAAQACLDGKATVAIFQRFAREFGAAAPSWNPPQDIAFRGWSATRTDREIRDATRQRFAHLALACERFALAGGLGQVVRQAALGEPAPWREGMPERAAHHGIEKTALGFALGSLGASSCRDSWAFDDRGRLAAGACQTFAMKSFRKALALMAPQEDDYSRLGGEACRWAFKAGGVPERLSTPAPHRDFSWPPSARRADDALKHFVSWIGGGASARAEPFFEGLLGASAQGADGEAMERFLQSVPAPSEAITATALAWATLRSANALDAPLSEESLALVWGGHLTRGQPGSARFAPRHMALSGFFPHSTYEAHSRSLASGPVAAAIEAAELDRCLRVYVHDPSLSGAPMEEGGLDEFEPAAPKRRMRL